MDDVDGFLKQRNGRHVEPELVVSIVDECEVVCRAQVRESIREVGLDSRVVEPEHVSSDHAGSDGTRLSARGVGAAANTCGLRLVGLTSHRNSGPMVRRQQRPPLPRRDGRQSRQH